MAAPRFAPHPLKTAVFNAGYPSDAEFCRETGIVPSHYSRVVNGRMASWPKFRRTCAEALGKPESELFPPDIVFRPVPITDDVPA